MSFNNKRPVISSILFAFVILFLLPSQANAQVSCYCQDGFRIPDSQISSCAQCPGLCDARGNGGQLTCTTGTTPPPGPGTGTEGPPAPYALKDPLGGVGPIEIAGNVINFALGILGVGVFVVFLIGGARILFSAGNPKMVEGGKKTLVYAVIGLAVIFLSYAVLNFFFTIFKKGIG